MFRSIVRAALAAAAIVLCSLPAVAASLEQMAGQMVIVGFSGDDADDKSVVALRRQIADGLLGGVMYLKPNVKSLAAVTAMNAAFRAAAPADLPPFLALDQEGGMVERLTSAVGFTELPRAAEVARAQSPQQAEATYAGMARALAKAGFTVNFAPVVDLDVNPRNPVIGRFGRAFAADPKRVADYAAAFVRAHHAAGLLTSLKHFPGHGSSTADSHEGFVDITRTWKATELAPYRRLIEAGLVDMVMVGHLYYAAYGAGSAQLPASLSPKWIEGVLRGELGYAGVVVSDDLEMGAIRKRFSLEQSVIASVKAGVDVLLFSNTASYDPGLAARVRGILVAEAERDPAFRARIEASYARIAAVKGRIGD